MNDRRARYRRSDYGTREPLYFQSARSRDQARCDTIWRPVQVIRMRFLWEVPYLESRCVMTIPRYLPWTVRLFVPAVCSSQRHQTSDTLYLYIPRGWLIVLSNLSGLSVSPISLISVEIHSNTPANCTIIITIMPLHQLPAILGQIPPSSPSLPNHDIFKEEAESQHRKSKTDDAARWADRHLSQPAMNGNSPLT